MLDMSCIASTSATETSSALDYWDCSYTAPQDAAALVRELRDAVAAESPCIQAVHAETREAATKLAAEFPPGEPANFDQYLFGLQRLNTLEALREKACLTHLELWSLALRP